MTNLVMSTFTRLMKNMNHFKIFKAKVENHLGLKIKVVKLERHAEYYDRNYDHGYHLCPLALFLQENGIAAQYTMPGHAKRMV